MWIKTKIAGPHGKRPAWAIPYKGFLIVRLPLGRLCYSVTHAPSGRSFGEIHGDVMTARCFIDAMYLVAKGYAISDPRPLDPTLPMEPFKKAYRDLIEEAEHGMWFCWPEIEAKRAKVLEQLAADRARRAA